MTKALRGYQDMLTQKALALMEELGSKAYGSLDLPELSALVQRNTA